MILFQSIGKILKIWIVMIMLLEVTLAAYNFKVSSHLLNRAQKPKVNVFSALAPKPEASSQAPVAQPSVVAQLLSLPLVEHESVIASSKQKENSVLNDVAKNLPQPVLFQQDALSLKSPEIILAQDPVPVERQNQEQQPFLVLSPEPVPQKYEHKPITIPVVDKTEGSAQNILDIFDLKVPADNSSFLQREGYQPSFTERLLGVSSSDVLETKRNETNVEKLQQEYLRKYNNDTEKAFIALQKDIKELDTNHLAARGNLEKNYEAVLTIAHKASARLNKQARDEKVKDILSNLADVQDVPVSQMLRDYTDDSVKLINDHFDDNLIEKILQEQSKLICQEVKSALDILKTLTANIEKKITPDKLTDGYLKSEEFKELEDEQLLQLSPMSTKINDFLKKSLIHQLQLKIKKIEVVEEQAKEVESLAETLWSDYREKKQIKDEITSLQEKLSENKSNLDDTQKQAIEKFSPDSFTSLKTKQEFIAKIREFKNDLNLDATKHQDIVDIIENTISTIEKLSDDVIKQAFADLKYKLLDVACKNKNYSQDEMNGVAAYKQGKNLNETAAPQEIKNLFKNFDDAQKDYQRKTSKKGEDKVKALQEALKKGFNTENYKSIIDEHIQAIKILNIKNENDKKIRQNAAAVGKTLFYSQKLNVKTVAWLREQILKLKQDSQYLLDDSSEELLKFEKEYGDQKHDLFNGIETNEDLIVFYETVLEQYENESWIGGFLRRVNTALDSMANKSSGRAVRDVSIAVGTGVIYVPMASVEAFNILSVSVDEYFASTFKIDINGPKYQAFKLAISAKILLPAAAALAAINASNMTIEQKTKAKHDVLSAVFADSVNYAAASSLGVSTDVLKSGDGQYIAETALLNQMINSLNNSTGHDYALDGHAASNTENLDAAMSKYRSYLSQDTTTSHGAGAYGG